MPYVYPVPLWEEAVGKTKRIKIYIFDIIDKFSDIFENLHDVQNFCQFYHISVIFLSSFIPFYISQYFNYIIMVESVSKD